MIKLSVLIFVVLECLRIKNHIIYIAYEKDVLIFVVLECLRIYIDN